MTRTTILARAAHQNSALEALIELSFALVDHGHDDPLICAAFRLVLDLGDHPTPARPALFATWTACCRDLAARVATFGPEPTPAPSPRSSPPHSAPACSAGSPDAVADLPHRVSQAWQLRLPAVTDPAAMEYFHQFALGREPHRTARRP
ncbi:TetR family transcriptional regulator [Rhodococcus opacus M213]|uniref:TetR family transcriptional regulator n=1 Tax=Rhodococcus opacus M213 TaxID=1129896 RepID=K8XU90_RHOOP|nr:hypothetical protein [Rhodococcus opacus]EKT84441.1 TetR family transcriptional regulator [Rhodococcus opacus M213]